MFLSKTPKVGYFRPIIDHNSNGNRDTANSTVTVLDTLNPSLIAQNITLILDSSRQGSITTADIDNAYNDACGLDTLYLSRYDFSCADTAGYPPATPKTIIMNVNKNTVGNRRGGC